MVSAHTVPEFVYTHTTFTYLWPFFSLVCVLSLALHLFSSLPIKRIYTIRERAGLSKNRKQNKTRNKRKTFFLLRLFLTPQWTGPP